MTNYEKVMLVIAIIALVVDLLTFLIKQDKKHKKARPAVTKLWTGL